MKKVCFISLFLTVAMLSAFAKGDKEGTYYVEKGPNNIFITGGVGSHMGLSGTNFDAGFFKAQNPHVYLGVGRMFHPNWSYRAVLNGWRSSDFITSMESKAYFGNLQLDLMYNMSQAWGGYRFSRSQYPDWRENLLHPLDSGKGPYEPFANLFTRSHRC